MFGKLSQLDRIACAVMGSLVILVSIVVASDELQGRHQRVDGITAVASPETECRIVEVPDGETVVVEMTRKLRVRLFNATGERETVSVAARDHLRALAENCDAVLYIPETRKQTQPFHLPETVAGSVHLVGDSETLAQHQVAAGYGPRQR